MIILNDEKRYREVKEGIIMMKSQRNDVKKISLIEEDKKIVINEVINERNEIMNNSLK